MTPEEQKIIDNIKNSHNFENKTQQKIFDSSVVIHLSNKLINENYLSLEMKIEIMNCYSKDYGFEGIQDVLNFREQNKQYLPN
jgi:hypothetical protein